MHPDDEALSGHLDGENDGTTAAHLASCPACRSRLADLAAVAAAVGQPVPPADPSVRQAAVAAALSTALAIPVTPRRRPSRVPTWAFAAAALVLAVAVAVPLLGHIGGRSSRTSSSARSAADRSAVTAVPSDSSAGLAAGGPAAGTADLGSPADQEALRNTLAQALAGRPQFVTPSDAGAAAPKTAAPSAQPATPAPDCLSAAVAAAGAPGDTLGYEATLRWQDQPARVFVFQPAGRSAVAVVVGQADCQVLVTFNV